MRAFLAGRLRLPLIAAPMFLVSGPALVTAACRAGVVGAFPTANCRSVEELDAWLTRFESELGPSDAPHCPNLIMRRASLADELACVLRHRVEMVIASVGSPEPVIGPLHDIGCAVFADVASLRHAEKALAAGADGLVLLTAGAGGQTGWANGFAFVRAVRELFAGPIVLAGGVCDGDALWAAEVLGCDLAYMGTKFIATHESLAPAAYKAMLVESRLDDILLTSAMTGLETNMLRPSIVAAGLDPRDLPAGLAAESSASLYGAAAPAAPRRWKEMWSAGHSVSGVDRVRSVADLVETTAREYAEARERTRARLG